MRKINIVLIIALVAIVGLLWYEEERMTQGNWREGTSFANLEVGDNLHIEELSLTFLGETQMNCDDFPEKAQEKCRGSKFFAFKINESRAPFKVYQGHLGAYTVLEGTPRFANMTVPKRDTVIFSSGNSYLFIDSPKGFYEIRYDNILSENLTRFKIETLFKRS